MFDAAEGLLKRIRPDEFNKKVLMTMAVCILQDYDEVLLLWVFGLGDGAVKLIRPLYEKVLTFAYLAGHAEEIKDFIDYSNIHWHKIFLEGAEVSNEKENWMAAEDRERILAKFAEVRDHFLTTDCKKCKTKKMMPSWTKKSTPELAALTHPVMRGMYFNGFLAPTMTIHPTSAGMFSQFQIATDGRMELNMEVAKHDNDLAFVVAISMLLVTISTINDFFQLSARELVEEVAARFAAFQSVHPFDEGVAGQT
jgi:hypothetical protein